MQGKMRSGKLGFLKVKSKCTTGVCVLWAVSRIQIRKDRIIFQDPDPFPGLGSGSISYSN
jgi:hypothetical protein